MFQPDDQRGHNDLTKNLNSIFELNRFTILHGFQ